MYPFSTLYFGDQKHLFLQITEYHGKDKQTDDIFMLFFSDDMIEQKETVRQHCKNFEKLTLAQEILLDNFLQLLCYSIVLNFLSISESTFSTKRD